MTAAGISKSILAQQPATCNLPALLAASVFLVLYHQAQTHDNAFTCLRSCRRGVRTHAIGDVEMIQKWNEIFARCVTPTKVSANAYISMHFRMKITQSYTYKRPTASRFLLE